MSDFTFAQWQVSRGIRPWTLHPRHITAAFAPLGEAIAALAEPMRQVADAFSAFSEAFRRADG